MTVRSDSPVGSDGHRVPQTDLEQLRAERDAALAKLARQDRRQRTGGAARRFFVGLLVALVAVLVPVTATTTWAHRTVVDTDHYVSTVAPIASDPAVRSAVARISTDSLYTALDPQQKIASALPPKAAFLAGPIANGLKGFLQTQVGTVLGTEAFSRIWTTANRVSHEQIIKVLDGKAGALQTTNGQVVLSVVPVLNQVLAAVQTQASALLGKSITLPRLTGSELPAAACAKLSAALGRPLPSTCGQIPLFPASKLKTIRGGYRAFNGGVVALLIVTPLLAALALWLTRRRRRTLMQMAAGAMLGMVVVRRAVIWLRGDLISTGRPAFKDARSAILHQLLGGFFTVSAWVLWIAGAVLVCAAVTGPYGWARSMRRWVRSTARSLSALTKAAFGHTGGVSSGGWVAGHVDLLRIAGAALAIILILAVSMSWIWLLVVLALTAAYEFWLYRVRASIKRPTDVADGPPPKVEPAPVA